MARTTARTRSTAPSAPRAFDIGSRRELDTIELTITDPEDGTVDTGIRVTIGSIFGTAAEEFLRKHVEEHGKLSTEEREIALASFCVKSWRTVSPEEGQPEDTVKFDGRYLPCDEASVREVFETKAARWFRQQVQVGISNRRGFFAKPKSS